ncbi:hypothetical protein GOV07_00035 [Candidatus Woesearchaeota archaeon]|nr:hypothetical protein [Candidatus Woesearchaeota archaeon]
MHNGNIEHEVERLWDEARTSQKGLSKGDIAALDAAHDATDAVWDNEITNQLITFTGVNIATARAFSSRILTRLLGVDYAGIASVASDALPPSASQAKDMALQRARTDALNTFSPGSIETDLETHYITAQPILLGSPLPVGAVLVISRNSLTEQQENLMAKYIRQTDTRLVLAEEILAQRKKNVELQARIPNENGVSVPGSKPYRSAHNTETANIGAGYTLNLFNVELPSEHYGAFINNLQNLTTNVLNSFDAAEHLFLNNPDGIDVKDGSKKARPYLTLLENMASLKHTSQALGLVTTSDVQTVTETGMPVNYGALTQLARQYIEDPRVDTVLDIMNDVGEDKEINEISAREKPYEFRIANTGEALAILALHQTVRNCPDLDVNGTLVSLRQAVTGYPAAQAYLLSFDSFDDVPLKNQTVYEQPHVSKTLLMKQNVSGIAAFALGLKECYSP